MLWLPFNWETSTYEHNSVVLIQTLNKTSAYELNAVVSV